MVELGQKMSLQQKQSPQQVLLSTLLQLPILGLEQRIKMELETNPVLEEVQEEELVQEPEEIMEEPAQELSLEAEEPEQKEEEEEEKAAPEVEVNENKSDIDWEILLKDEDDFGWQMPRDEGAEIMERPFANPTTLSEHLLNQLHLTWLSEKEMEIGEYIIWNINEDGYLSCDVEVIAENLGVTPEEVEKVLKVIQTFEPVGIGARNLQECLLIQLKSRKGSKEAIEIIQNYFDDFKNKRFEKIAKSMNISLRRVKMALQEISKLNPKPGEGYISQAENYVIPDVIIERVDDDFIVTLNEHNIPHLRISNAYKRMLADQSGVPKEVKEYIRKRIESARWLINSIHQRRVTIIKVVQAILNRQREFFERGGGPLKPMILKDIAEDVGLDISTVSRVTSGKYVQTDFGVFELRYFFSERLQTSSGEEVSNKQIKDRIREIIENENPRRPLTDQEIVDILAKEGFLIARRTVAKYREQMRIPVARLRRKI